MTAPASDPTTDSAWAPLRITIFRWLWIASLALLVGAEGPGLRPETLARCTNVRIPMHHGVDSLNVGHAVAATLAVIDANRNLHPEPGVQRS